MAVYDRTQILDWSLDPANRYTVWSGLAGGFFLAMSYFGTDQSQVGRYLGGKSLREIRIGLTFTSLIKIPMQLFILGLGLLLFTTMHFTEEPLWHNPAVAKVWNGNPEHEALDQEWRRDLQVDGARRLPPSLQGAENGRRPSSHGRGRLALKEQQHVDVQGPIRTWKPKTRITSSWAGPYKAFRQACSGCCWRLFWRGPCPAPARN